jgi:hypothetical protein
MQNGSTHRACNEELQHPFAVRRSQRILAYHTMDATDTALLGRRFYGCPVPHLYNESRPHASLADRTPSEFASQYAASRILAETKNSRGLTSDLVQEN